MTGTAMVQRVAMDLTMTLSAKLVVGRLSKLLRKGALANNQSSQFMFGDHEAAVDSEQPHLTGPV